MSMLNTPLKYQFSIFGMFDDITPNTDNLQYFITSFSKYELLPTSFKEAQLSLNNITEIFSSANAKDRIKMKSSNDLWDLTFKSNRIDIIKNNIDFDGNSIGNCDQFINDVLDIVKIIDAKFQRKYNRLAFVTRYLGDKVEEGILDLVYNKVFHSIDFFKENNPYEWNNKISTTIVRKINDKNETINSLVEFKRALGELIKPDSTEKEKTDRVELQIDLNTSHLNAEYRFDIQAIGDFTKTTLNVEKEIKDAYILNYLKND